MSKAIKNYEAQLVRLKKNYLLDKEVLKQNINAELTIRLEKQVIEIRKNYDMGFINLFEMVTQRLESLKQVQSNMFPTKE
jgi:hypothetical protein